MGIKNKAITFECEGQCLVGILSLPADPQIKVTTGLITLPAGGPQYRVGMGRQLLQLAHYLAERGVAVLRFDTRGIGDSEGDFGGFMSVEPDLKAAIAAFKEELPDLSRLALWGGCNAASAIMIHGWKFPEVTHYIISNPFLGSSETSAQAKKMHFAERVKEREFWVKLFSGKYNLLDYARGFARHITKKVSPQKTKAPTEANLKPGAGASIQEQMLSGMQQFNGESLVYISGRSIQSKEFQALIKHSAGWRNAFSDQTTVQKFLPEADQAFSRQEDRAEIISFACEWLESTASCQKGS